MKRKLTPIYVLNKERNIVRDFVRSYYKSKSFHSKIKARQPLVGKIHVFISTSKNKCGFKGVAHVAKSPLKFPCKDKEISIVLLSLCLYPP